MHFSRILIPVDFSPCAERALETGQAWARHFDAELHLLHSYYLHSPWTRVDHLAEYSKEFRVAAENRLHEWRIEHCADVSSVIEHIIEKQASQAIVSLAHELPADLIVMGTRGASGLKHVVLGSVAERVLRLAPCPVVTVKDSP